MVKKEKLMRQTHLPRSTLLALSLLLLAGCTSIEERMNPQYNYYYSGIYFGKHLSEDSKKGIIDGCKTSKGRYHKSHKLFKGSSDYENGWFIGRSKCRDLLEIPSEKSR
jgi:uncharacterized protein YceK